MKKQSNAINKRLESWINNRLLIIFEPNEWDLEFIYIYCRNK